MKASPKRKTENDLLMTTILDVFETEDTIFKAQGTAESKKNWSGDAAISTSKGR